MAQVFRGEVTNYDAFVEYLEPPRACPLCSAPEAAEWAKQGPFRAVRCEACDLVYMERILSEEGLNKYYNGYIAFRLETAKEKLAQRAEMYKADREYLTRHASAGRLLDIGCSAGDFLQLLESQFDCYGLERDASAVRVAQERGGPLSERIRQGTLEEAAATLPTMDVVVMRGVIEHFAEPADVLAKVSGLLRPGGTFFISATPNVDCLCAEVFREKWNQFDPVQHITHFSARTLAKGADRFGLALRAQYYPYLDTPYARPEQDLAIVRQAVILESLGRHDELPRSPAFWGNMMTLIFEKR